MIDTTIAKDREFVSGAWRLLLGDAMTKIERPNVQRNRSLGHVGKRRGARRLRSGSAESSADPAEISALRPSRQQTAVIRVIFERHSHCLDFVGELVIRMLNVMTGEVQTDPRKTRTFDAKAFLDSPEMAGSVADYRPTETVYSQGDPSDTLLYIQQGAVKLTVVSPTGREAVVGMLGAGEFFGEGALAGQPVRLDTATAMTVSRIRVVPKGEMIRLLHQQSALSDRFIAHLLARNNRLEADLVDQLFNACEKRLARTLLLLARYGQPDGPRHGLPAISQEVLAEMVGTTRSRVNVFMNKFRKLGFVDYNKDGVTVHPTLLRVVLHDSPASDH